jgi:hypothetical protein
MIEETSQAQILELEDLQGTVLAEGAARTHGGGQEEAVRAL